MVFCLLVCGVIREGKMVEREKKDKKIEKGDFLFKICIVYLCLYIIVYVMDVCVHMHASAHRGKKGHQIPQS